jgi:hypothetical protein
MNETVSPGVTVTARVTRHAKNVRHTLEGGGDGHAQTMRKISAGLLIPQG